MSSTHHQNRKNVELISGKVVMEEVPGFPIGQPEFIPAKKIAKQVMALMHVSVFYCMYKLIWFFERFLMGINYWKGGINDECRWAGDGSTRQNHFLYATFVVLLLLISFQFAPSAFSEMGPPKSKSSCWLAIWHCHKPPSFSEITN